MISRVAWHSCPAAFLNPVGSLPARTCDVLLAQLLEQGYRTWNISKYFSISHKKGSPTPKARERKLLTIKWLGEEALVHKTKLSYKISMRLFVPFGVYEVLSRFFCCPRPCSLGCWKRVTASIERDSLSAVFVPSLTTLFFLCLSVLPPLKKACLSEGLSFTSWDTLEFTHGKREKIIEIITTNIH